MSSLPTCRHGRIAAISLALAAGALGCGQSTTETPAPKPAAVLVVNGSTSPVTVTAAGTSAVSVAPGTFSGLLSVAPGSQTVHLAAAQGAVDVPVTPQNGQTSVVAALLGAGNTLVGQAIVDTNAVAPAGASKLRVIHLAAGYGRLDIWRAQPDYPTPLAWVRPEYGRASEYYQSTPGNWEVRVGPTWDAPQAKLTVPVADAQSRTVVVLADSAQGLRIEALP